MKILGFDVKKKKPNSRQLITKEMKDSIFELSDDNYTVGEIAAELDLPASSVSRRLTVRNRDAAGGDLGAVKKQQDIMEQISKSREAAEDRIFERNNKMMETMMKMNEGNQADPLAQMAPVILAALAGNKGVTPPTGDQPIVPNEKGLVTAEINPEELQMIKEERAGKRLEGLFATYKDQLPSRDPKELTKLLKKHEDQAIEKLRENLSVDEIKIYKDYDKVMLSELCYDVEFIKEESLTKDKKAADEFDKLMDLILEIIRKL